MSRFVFVLGSQKCGTTSLAAILGGHPEIFVPSVKETYFFLDDDKYSKGTDWYNEEYFSGRKEPLFCDATPFCLASREAILRIKSFSTENTKYIVILRNPVDRAYSAYWHQVRLGNESLSFEQAISVEKRRVQDARERKQRWWRFAYTTVGLYAEQVAFIYKKLANDNIIILEQSDLNNRIGLGEQLANFLQVSNSFDMSSNLKNQASIPRFPIIQTLVNKRNPLKSLSSRFIPRQLRSSLGQFILERTSKSLQYPPMSLETREMMTHKFQESNQALIEMGYDFAEQWLAAG